MNTLQKRILAPAKVNLFLRVLGKRSDGYHDIETVFVPVEGICDAITVRIGGKPGIALRCSGGDVPEGPSNLCWGAADSFLSASGCTFGVEIDLEKGIPVAAGLGGGSSDAAVVLRMLNDLSGDPLDDPPLRGLARGLGADVPFFLNPTVAYGGGVGDVLSPAALRTPLSLILVNSGFPISASWAYSHWDRVTGRPAPSGEALIRAMADGGVAAIAAGTYNSLEFAAFDKFPVLEVIRERLLELGGLCVRVSGSGPTMFSIFPHGETESACEVLAEEFGPRFWVRGVTIDACCVEG